MVKGKISGEGGQCYHNQTWSSVM